MQSVEDASCHQSAVSSASVPCLPWLPDTFVTSLPDACSDILPWKLQSEESDLSLVRNVKKGKIFEQVSGF